MKDMIPEIQTVLNELDIADDHYRMDVYDESIVLKLQTMSCLYEIVVTEKEIQIFKKSFGSVSRQHMQTMNYYETNLYKSIALCLTPQLERFSQMSINQTVGEVHRDENGLPFYHPFYKQDVIRKDEDHED